MLFLILQCAKVQIKVSYVARWYGYSLQNETVEPAAHIPNISFIIIGDPYKSDAKCPLHVKEQKSRD